MSRESLKQNGRRQAGFYLIGNRDQFVGGNPGQFGIRAPQTGRGYPIPRSDGRDVFAHRNDPPGTFPAGSKGQRRPIEAGALVNLDEVESDCLQPDHRLSRFRCRVRHVLQPENLWPASLMDPDGLHSISRIAATSTATLKGNDPAPTANRACLPAAAPNTSTRRSDAPLATSG